MDRLYAPWRIEWIRREERNAEVDGCVFCALPAEGTDRTNRLVARSEHAFVLLNNYPYNPGHAMVIPYEHTGEYRDLTDEVLLDHARLKARTFEALEAAFEPDGFNAGLNLGEGSGGSIAGHLHTHVVPRWAGDTNFMPVVGDAKVIVEAVDDTYDALRSAFTAQEGTTTEDEDAAVLVDS